MRSTVGIPVVHGGEDVKTHTLCLTDAEMTELEVNRVRYYGKEQSTR